MILGMLLFYALYSSKAPAVVQNFPSIAEIIVVLILLFAALFTTNFIAKKNALSKESAYTVLFYLLIIAAFPSVFNNLKLLCAQFFILLATRRLISLHTMKSSKEKLFDASLWVFVASLFYFWSILFIVLVYISILFHVARDYRAWFLPLLAFVTVALLYFFCAYMWNPLWIDSIPQQAQYSTALNFNASKPADVIFLSYVAGSVLATLALMITLTNRPLLLHSSFKKVISAVVIGLCVYGFAPIKSNELLVFTATPMAIIFTSHIEAMTGKWQKEFLLFALLIGSVTAFVFQL